jgi:hypothetical protein
MPARAQKKDKSATNMGPFVAMVLSALNMTALSGLWVWILNFEMLKLTSLSVKCFDWSNFDLHPWLTWVTVHDREPTVSSVWLWLCYANGPKDVWLKVFSMKLFCLSSPASDWVFSSTTVKLLDVSRKFHALITWTGCFCQTIYAGKCSEYESLDTSGCD